MKAPIVAVKTTTAAMKTTTIAVKATTAAAVTDRDDMVRHGRGGGHLRRGRLRRGDWRRGDSYRSSTRHQHRCDVGQFESHSLTFSYGRPFVTE